MILVSPLSVTENVRDRDKMPYSQVDVYNNVHIDYQGPHGLYVLSAHGKQYSRLFSLLRAWV